MSGTLGKNLLKKGVLAKDLRLHQIFLRAIVKRINS